MDLKDLLNGIDNAEQIAAQIKENAKAAKCKLFIDDGDKNKYVPLSRLNDKIAELKTATDTITTLNQSVATLKTQVADSEKAQSTIKDLETKLENYQGVVKQTKIDTALQLLASEYKAKDVNDIKAFLDLDKVTITATGEVVGAKEQIEDLAKNKAYLFDAVEPAGEQGGQGAEQGGTPFPGTGVPGKAASSFAFGSTTSHAGDFGKMLAVQYNGIPQSQEGNQAPIGVGHFFGEDK